MRDITFRNIWYSWKYVQKLNESEDIQKNWAGKISSGSWQRLPARTLPHPRRANFVHVWNLRNIYLLKLLFPALLIIILIMFCDYCLQTFLSTSTVSFAPLLLNIASISSCPYLRENVGIKPSRWFSTQSFKLWSEKNGNSSWLAIRRRTPLPPSI